MNRNLKKVIGLFKDAETVRSEELFKTYIGRTCGKESDYTRLGYELTQVGYKITRFSVEHISHEGRRHPAWVNYYRLYKFTRDDCWPCGIEKTALKHCWNWQRCCNGHPDRGSRRCELAEQEECKRFNFAITKE